MFIPPAKGLLACGDVGEGRLAEVDDIVAEVVGLLRQRDDLKGIKVLVTAGPTREYIDPVRFVSNPSSGRMGYAIADACRKRGAEVHLITGPTNIKAPFGVHVYRVETAYEMYDAVMSLFDQCQIVFKTAAVGDYRPDMVSSQKIKKDADDLVIRFVKNPDILKELGRRKKNQILVGFAAETENIEAYANKKLKEKNLDFIFVNDVSKTGAGFAGDTNGGILLCADGDRLEMSITKKEIIAQHILDVIIDRKLDK
ncbi:MAG: Phosphopantothenoylcysteine decarboxylase / phosphopantothenate---cysteine ligase [Xylanivirga thermophila]|jgi:phosphopantothenoylcysteine decarboxylase / phosphopantothenate---cysteine ligase|uniref:bifunctional phosphopantothenoylcysteine decarboxylase/phosphopantothenate--cysteine ligase CoaBC n=1 Tax=Xylanivirga thermophila TaxID=2496273 RepID=UPI0039F56A1E